MTIGALEHRVVARIRMTGGADPIRIPVVDREVRVIESRSCPSRRGMASRARSRETRRCVIRIRRAVVVRLVATHARCRQRRVVVVHVAIGAGHGRVRTGQRERRRVVIERRSAPVCCAVAGIARRRETYLRVVGIGRRSVVLLVARHARSVRARQSVVAVHVARAAGRRGMRARQREAGGRMVECPVAPVRRAVALVARLGEACLHVVRIGRALEIGQVALCARPAAQLVVVVRVALRALKRHVGPGQSETGSRVVKGSARPRCGVVALRASLREARCRVRRIVGRVEVVLVATDTRRVGGGQVVIAVHVALDALQRDMRASQREAGGRVIERRVTPRRRGVALLASLREIRLHVVRIGGALEILQMARYASRVRAGQVVIAVHVALHALQRSMRAGQGEAGGRVIKRRITPRGRGVALLASLREIRLHVIRIGGALEILQVAAHASRVRAGQVVIVVHVALHALHSRVCARQREAGGRVIERCSGPCRGAVALLAGLRESSRDVIWVGGALEIRQVAAHARRVRAGQIVVAIHVALCALRGRVRPGQGEAGGRMVEIRAHPRSRVVALRAGLREPGLHVVRIGGALEVLQVAAHASRIGVGQAVVVVHVALRALHRGVRSRQREAGRCMVKTRACPSGGVVALRASL